MEGLDIITPQLQDLVNVVHTSPHYGLESMGFPTHTIKVACRVSVIIRTSVPIRFLLTKFCGVQLFVLYSPDPPFGVLRIFTRSSFWSTENLHQTLLSEY